MEETKNEVKNEVSKAETVTAPAPVDMTASEMIFNDANFTRANQLAEIMASGRCAVPKHLQGSVGDCFAIIVQAAQWKMNPFVVAQKTHVVNGALGYEAQLVNAVITSMGVTSDRFRYEYVGDWDAYRASGYNKSKETGCGVNVGATLKGETEVRFLPMPLCMEQVKTRNSPLWATNPQQQIAYLAVKYWARLYAPDAILGVYSDDELAQTEMVNVTPESERKAAPAAKSKTSALKEKLIDTKAEEIKFDVIAAVKTSIAATKAPVEVGDVEAFLKRKAVLKADQTLAGDFDSIAADWQKYIRQNTADLVNKAANETVK